MKRMLAALLLSIATFANATTFSTDASDLWWVQAENGWGVNVVQQHDILFMTFFVYAQNGAPTWYSASETRYVRQEADGSLVFTGPLFQTTGPWFGGAWNPSSVTYREVGTVTFTMSDIDAARLTYTVDGIGVIKNLTRTTWRVNNLAGIYLGATIGTYAGCTSAGTNGYAEESGVITVNQSATSISFAAVSNGVTCTYSGPYTQGGRMGHAAGSVSCSNGRTGNFEAIEIEGSISGFTARIQSSTNVCNNFIGRIGGMRRGP